MASRLHFARIAQSRGGFIMDLRPTRGASAPLRTALFSLDPAGIVVRIRRACEKLDLWVVRWMARIGVLALRIGLGIVFCWFGALKFVPGLSPAEDLATRTMQVLSLGFVPPHVGIVVLATWECIIGLGLMMNVAMRLTLGLLFLQMLGTLTPLALFPGELFAPRYFAPTLEGQYIIKNLVLIGGALVLGATVRGGSLVAEPE